jgi:hypothetical protein
MFSLLLLSLLYSVAVHPNQNSSTGDVLVDIFLVCWLLFGMLVLAFGMFVTLENNVLCRTDYFFWKKRIIIDDIVQVSNPPTFGFGTTHRTLTITAKKEGKYETITMSYPAFSKQTLSSLVIDLRHINPNVRISADAQSLLTNLQ